VVVTSSKKVQAEALVVNIHEVQDYRPSVF
jgi:hypothetical protein